MENTGIGTLQKEPGFSTRRQAVFDQSAGARASCRANRAHFLPFPFPMPDDDIHQTNHSAPGWTPPARSPWPARSLGLALAAAAFGFLFTPLGQRIGRGVSNRLFPERTAAPRSVVQEKIVERRVEVPVMVPPPALPSGPSLSPRGGDLTTLFSGIGLKTSLIPSQGDTATEERASNESYSIEMTLKVRIPKPATTMDQIRRQNPNLGNLLPELAALINQGKVSGFYHYLYDLKEKAILTNLKRLDKLPTRHNFYDLDTLLELEHQTTKQKVLLMQADMDVVSDGSDGDRMPSFDDYILKSTHFQPSTSYGWPKVTTKLNPVIPKLEDELREAREKLKTPRLTKEEKASLSARIEEIPRITGDLKKRSYLIGQEDPFIVIPSSLRSYKGRNAWTPGIGDYAVVIYGDLLLPAVVGDYGPTVKVGEASLRIGRQLNPQSNPYLRPVSDLKVTYLIFPDSADATRKAPDYVAWRARCQDLIGKIGGIGSGYSIFEWEDRLKPSPALPANPPPDASAPPAPSPPAPAGGAQASPAPVPAADTTPHPP